MPVLLDKNERRKAGYPLCRLMEFFKKYQIKEYIGAAVAVASAAVTAAVWLKSRKKGRELERIKRVNKSLAARNMDLMELACDEIGISRGWENRILPIDSEEVMKLRMMVTVNSAERALYRALVYCMGKNEDNCIWEDICSLVRGEYVLNSATSCAAQLYNAETTVGMVESALGSEREYFLAGYPRETFVKAAVLLENDIAWAEEMGGDCN